MEILVSLFFLVLGFFTLALSSSRSIDYSLQAAEMFSISKLFVGFVLLAVSTGLPELLIAIQSLLLGEPMLSAGDIIGSNFVVVSLSFGFALAIFGPANLPSGGGARKRQLRMLILSSLLMLFIFAIGTINRFIGLVLICIYVLGITYLWYTRKQTFEQEIGEQLEIAQKHIEYSSRPAVLMRLGGCLLLVIFSSKVCVDSALEIAQYFGLPLEMMGASIVAIGTSLPEIILNLQAVRKGNISLALGNSLGSVFEQGAFILGLLAIGSPQPIALYSLRPIAPFMFAAYGILGYQLWGDREFSKLDGVLLVSCYGLFLLYGLIRFYA